MLSYLFALPRASWKVRVVVTFFFVLGVWSIFQTTQHLHDDLALARWMAWLNIIGDVFYLPLLAVIVFFGRLPRFFVRLTAMWNKTLPQIHADIAREQQEQRERSREL